MKEKPLPSQRREAEIHTNSPSHQHCNLSTECSKPNGWSGEAGQSP